jgi:glutamate synthase domain-containing protein 3
MTGGHAYVYDANESFERRCNRELISLARLRGDGYEALLKSLLVEHHEKTGSQIARLLVEDWETQRQFFWHVMPKDNVVQLEAATEGSAESEEDEEKAKA